MPGCRCRAPTRAPSGRRRRRLGGRRRPHLAALGELHRVADRLCRIWRSRAASPTVVSGRSAVQCESRSTPLASAWAENTRRRRGCGVVQIEALVRHAHATGLEVQRVVDQREQRHRAAAAPSIWRWPSSRRVPRSSSLADDADAAAWISWLMLARKRLSPRWRPRAAASAACSSRNFTAPPVQAEADHHHHTAARHGGGDEALRVAAGRSGGIQPPRAQHLQQHHLGHHHHGPSPRRCSAPPLQREHRSRAAATRRSSRRCRPLRDGERRHGGEYQPAHMPAMVALPRGRRAQRQRAERAAGEAGYRGDGGKGTDSTISITIAHRDDQQRLGGWWPSAIARAAPRCRAGARRGRASRQLAGLLAQARRTSPAGRGSASWSPAAEASGAPSRTCTSASIASARMARLDSVSAAACSAFEDGHPGAGQHGQRCRQNAPLARASRPMSGSVE